MDQKLTNDAAAAEAFIAATVLISECASMIAKATSPADAARILRGLADQISPIENSATRGRHATANETMAMMPKNRPPLFTDIPVAEGHAMVLIDAAVLDAEGLAVIEFTTQEHGAFHFAIEVEGLRRVAQQFLRSAMVLENTETHK